MLLALTLAATLIQPPKDLLSESFRNPPASARPHTWWHWMNGNVTKEGITADLEAMREVGIGGAQMFTVDQGIPAGPAKYNGKLWHDLTTHAIKEAGRLGIELCIHNCAGWSSSGGPWVKPEHAMQVVAWSTVKVRGPKKFSEWLPDIKAPQVYAKVPYSKDIAVFAFKTPAETQRPPDFLGKTGVVRQDGLQPDFSPAPAESIVGSGDIVQLSLHKDGKLDWDVPAGDWTILRMGHVPTGKDNHPAPPEGDGLEVDKLSREALDAFWAGLMAKVVQNAGPLAGKVLNNALVDSYEVGSQNWTPKMREEFKTRRAYDMTPWLPVLAGFTIESREKSERFLWDLRKTIAELYAENYFGYFGELCHKAGLKFSTEPYGNGGFDAIEVGGTADIPMGEFWIPNGMAMDTTRVAASVGHIYGRKIIGAESFTADDVRGKFMEEPYSAKALGDLVFTNGVNRYIFHRYAAQPWLDLKPGMTMGPWGSHLERTQTWWTEAQAWMKYIARCQYLLQSGTFVADTLYYRGENSPVDWAYLPGQNPGYDYDSCDVKTLFKLTVKDGKLVLPSGMAYRVLVLPETPFMTYKTLDKIEELVKAGAVVLGPKPTHTPTLQGYPNVDGKVRALAEKVWGPATRDAAVARSYGKGKVFWGMPLADVYKQLRVAPDFEFSGFTYPQQRKMAYIHRKIGDADVYFVSNQRYRATLATCTFRVNGKVPELWHPDTGVVEAAPIYESMGGRTSVQMAMGPAESVFVVFRKGTPRKSLKASLYPSEEDSRRPYIVVRSARYEAADGRGADVTARVAQLVNAGEFEISATNAEFGDPVVNVVKRLVVEYEIDGKSMRKVVPENETLVFFLDGAASYETPYQLKVTPKGVEGVFWKLTKYTLADNPNAQYGFLPPKKIDLSTNWRVNFPPKWGAPPSVEMPKLISWPDHKDEGVKYFSGSAVYVKEFDVPGGFIQDAAKISLGRVKNFATVKLNGKELSVLWKEPFEVDVTGALKPGKNRLEIKITNLWPNRLIGDEQLPEDAEWNGVNLKKWPDWLTKGQPRPNTGRYTFTTWKFWKKDSTLLESGLIGPVVLKSAKKVMVP